MGKGHEAYTTLKSILMILLYNKLQLGQIKKMKMYLRIACKRRTGLTYDTNETEVRDLIGILLFLGVPSGFVVSKRISVHIN